MRITALTTIFILLISSSSIAKKKNTTSNLETVKAQAISDIQSRYEEYKKIALQIWGFAEVGYKEEKSSALLQKTLSDNGFDVKAGVAEIPTAFVASYGSGKP